MSTNWEDTIYGHREEIQDLVEALKDVPDEKINIGRFGEMRSRWLTEQSEKQGLMCKEEERLIMTGHPNRELAYFNELVKLELAGLTEKMYAQEKQDEPTEYLKKVGFLENIRVRAEEIIAAQMIYV